MYKSYLEGAIISNHRKLQQITQDTLGEGICSKTHLSKIENGQTHVNEETLELLAERLGISLLDKKRIFETVERDLHVLFHHLSCKDTFHANECIERLEALKENFFYINDICCHFELLKLWYLVEQRQFDLVVQSVYFSPSARKRLQEQHIVLYDLIQTIYHYYQDNTEEALTHIRKINVQTCPYQEVFFFLGALYYESGAYNQALSYLYQSRQYFFEMKNYRRLFDTEILILNIIENDETIPYDTLSKTYLSLLSTAQQLNLPAGKAALLHNYAQMSFASGYFTESARLFEEARNKKKKLQMPQINSTFGYIRAVCEGGLLDKETLQKTIQQGLYESSVENNDYYYRLIQEFEKRLTLEESSYFEYIETDFLPFLSTTTNKFYFDKFINHLVEYYITNQRYEKVIHLLQTYDVRVQKKQTFL